MSLVHFDPCIVTVKHSIIFIINFQLSTSTLFYLNLEVHWDWPAVSEAIRGWPGYIIYYKLDKHKEIRRYISVYILQQINTILLKYKDNIGVKFWN